MLYLGSEVKFYDLLRMQLAVGQALDQSEARQNASIGLGIQQQNYSFFYTVSKNHQSYSDLHSALTLHVYMNI